jgi:dihydroxy-acid dehydratase
MLLDTQQIIRPLDNPIKSTGHIQILYGNLAPEGSVAKITGKEGLFFSGVFLLPPFSILGSVHIMCIF